MDGLNREKGSKRLPRYLLVVPDKDLLEDIDVNDTEAKKQLAKIVNWLTRQINIAVCRKKLQVSEKKPGAVCSDDPTIIYVTMIRRVQQSAKGTKLEKLCRIRPVFNELINEAAARQQNKVMTIKSCNLLEHFDQWGNLTASGREAYWQEVDSLLEQFDQGNLKFNLKICKLHPDASTRQHKQRY